MPTITIEMLRAIDACDEEVFTFYDRFGDELTWETDAEAQKLAREHGGMFEVAAAIDCLLSSRGRDACWRELKDWQRHRSHVWGEYRKMRALVFLRQYAKEAA